ncbi:MAG: hypothetical protein ACO3DT_04505, partial [Gammaproteobacteria bacterium]
MIKLSKGTLSRSLVTAAITVMSLHNAQAAPGNLPTAPLFLSTIVEPNVFFTLDDSGSMDWEPMMSSTTGLATGSGLPFIDGRLRGYYTPTFNHLYDASGGFIYVLPPADGTHAEWDKTWVVRNHLANRNYYNPNIKYQPWPGTEADGSPMYEDADPKAALEHPDIPVSAGGESVNLLLDHTYTEPAAGAGGTLTAGTTSTTYYIPTYYKWSPTDGDGDGVIEESDLVGAAVLAARVEIPRDATDPEMINFANWFQYYRSRMNATKSVVGGTINNTDASRMGIRMYNTGQMEDLATMSDTALKRTLLRNLYSFVTPARGTPARTALEATGDYFADNTSGAILSAAEGGECQQNFNLLMSDGFWNGGTDPSVGNTDTDGAGPYDGNAAQSNDGGNYADAYSNTLADVAMDNYENDLRTDLADLVPTQTGIDEADHQHLVTFTIGFGLNGTLDPSVDDPLAVGFTWPEPISNSITTVDDMWHAAYNGRGRYLSAQNPEELQKSMSAAINDIAQRTGTAAAVAINSAQLSTESVVYLAQFNSNRWQGDLLAFPIVDTDTGELSAAPKWSAASGLNARDIATKPRTMMTLNDALLEPDGVAFTWSDISPGMMNDLLTNPTGGTDPAAVGQARLDFIRGDRSNEGTLFRSRASMLADIVNSGPVFVGPPGLSWPDVAPFPE